MSEYFKKSVSARKLNNVHTMTRLTVLIKRKVFRGSHLVLYKHVSVHFVILFYPEEVILQ